jgi:hypothetical protein
MDLGTLVDKIQAYNNLLTQHGFEPNPSDGKKPWSHRHTKGDTHIDTRNSEWTAYQNDTELCSGPDPQTLAAYLTEDYKNGLF